MQDSHVVVLKIFVFIGINENCLHLLPRLKAPCATKFYTSAFLALDRGNYKTLDKARVRLRSFIAARVMAAITSGILRVHAISDLKLNFQATCVIINEYTQKLTFGVMNKVIIYSKLIKSRIAHRISLIAFQLHILNNYYVESALLH